MGVDNSRPFVSEMTPEQRRALTNDEFIAEVAREIDYLKASVWNIASQVIEEEG